MNEMHDLLEDISRNYPAKKAPKQLVEKFIESLREEKVEVKRPDNFTVNLFLAQKKNQVLILAHESTSISWWGVTKQIIDRIIKKEFLLGKEFLWGMALIDGDCRRGFWIPGKNFPELVKLRIVTLGKTEQYNFNKSALEKRRDLAPEFGTLRRFIQLSGLE